MSTHVRETDAAVPAANRRPLPQRIAVAAGLVAAVLLAGCSVAPQDFRSARGNPVDSATDVPAVTYRSTTASYVRLRPVAPAGWQQQNQRVTPKPAPGQ